MREVAPPSEDLDATLEQEKELPEPQPRRANRTGKGPRKWVPARAWAKYAQNRSYDQQARKGKAKGKGKQKGKKR